MRRPASTRTRDGFSFLEVLIAMAILSIAIIALADLFLISIKKNAQSAEQSRLAVLAQDKLDELIALPYANIAGGTDSVRLESNLTAQTYTRDWRVLAATPEPNCKTITVTINGVNLGGGKGYMGKRQRVQLSMIKVGPLGGAITRN